MLPAEAFRRNPRNRDGLDSWCRRCHAEATREWRAANPEHIAEYNERRRAEYAAEHPRTSRPCIVCGKPFSKRADALVCGEDCRKQRKAEQRRKAAVRCFRFFAAAWPGSVFRQRTAWP
jgi:predicted nucleic acid-binding Zn ribbon protein